MLTQSFFLPLGGGGGGVYSVNRNVFRHPEYCLASNIIDLSNIRGMYIYINFYCVGGRFRFAATHFGDCSSKANISSRTKEEKIKILYSISFL